MHEKIYKNGIDLSSRLIEFINTSNSLFVFVPYIKIETLKSIIEENHIKVKAVFVKWETKDLIWGSSDIEIFPYLKEKGIALYRNPRIHLKAFVDQYNRCMFGSANISARALNMPESNSYNYEIATIVNELNLEDRLYFNIIESESTLITENIYNQIIEQLPEKKKEFPDELDFSLKLESPDKSFLISSLPMTYSVDTLCRIYEEMSYLNDTELNCALHDLAIYRIPLGLSIDEFKLKLIQSFFEHPFIKGFISNLEKTGEIYFGMAKEWIHYNCTDVPTPRKWEITENIQILYRWIEKLGEGKFRVDRPNYSERLSINY
jgi:hypothetical protein